MARRSRSPSRGTDVTLYAFLACDGISRDPGSGKSTIYGIFDRLYVKELPAAARFSIYFRAFCKKGKHTLVVKLIGPNGKQVGTESPQFDFQAKAGGSVIEMQMMAAGFEVTSHGEHRLVAVVDGTELSRYNITIEKPPAK